MDWTKSHELVLDCKDKNIYFIDDTGHEIIGMNKGVSLRFISMLKLKKSLRKGCKLYIVTTMKKRMR
jgi:hypothetical protein